MLVFRILNLLVREPLTSAITLFHNFNMKKLYLSLCILLCFAGCADDEIVKPSFPDIVNPLDQDDVFTKAFSGATKLSDLFKRSDNGLEFYSDSNGLPFNGWVKRTYDDGKVGFLFQCKNGKQDGLHTAWYPNGQKMVERTWRNGLRDGPYKTWTEAGNLESRGYHLNNLVHGQVEEFYPNGLVKSKSQYIEGKVDTFVGWKPDGSICPNSSIAEGSGTIFVYNEDGSVDYNVSYANGGIDYGEAIESNTSLLIEESNSLAIDDANLSGVVTGEPE